MDFSFKLNRNSRSWSVVAIRTLNLPFHVVPSNRQNPDFYPDFFHHYLRYHLQNHTRLSTKTTTMTVRLHGNEIHYFYKHLKLHVGDVELNVHDDRREEARNRRILEDRRRRISRLKFVHGRDNCLRFKDQFLQAFNNSDPNAAKLYLMNFVKPEHLQHFEILLPNATLDQLMTEFVVYYDRDEDYHLNQLRNTPLSMGLHQFVTRRLEYQKAMYPALPFKFHRQRFIQELPDNLRIYFEDDQLPDLVLSNPSRIIQHIQYKLSMESLNNQEQQNPVPAEVSNEAEINNLANSLGRPSTSNYNYNNV